MLKHEYRSDKLEELRDQHTDMSTRTIQISRSFNGRRFPPAPPRPGVAANPRDAVSSTDHYPFSGFPSPFSLPSPFLSGGTLVDGLLRSNNSSEMTLVDKVSSSSDLETLHMRRRGQG